MKVNGAALRAIRTRSGMTGVELAATSGVDTTVISRLENGHRHGTPAQLLAIADALRVPVAAIVAAESAVA